MAYAPKRQPVYRVHKYRGGGYCYMRRPHTAEEHKLNQVIDNDEPKCRPKRGSRLLVDAWDDEPRCVQRSWKVQNRLRQSRK